MNPRIPIKKTAEKVIPTDLNVRKLRVIIGDFIRTEEIPTGEIPTGEIRTEAIRTKEIRIAMDPIEGIYLVALASVFALIPSGPGYAGTQEAATAYWHAIADEVGANAARSVLVVDQREGQRLPEETMAQLLDVLHAMGLAAVRLELVETQLEHFAQAEAPTNEGSAACAHHCAHHASAKNHKRLNRCMPG